MVKKRGIAKKPTEQTAADWVSAGGVDPELIDDSKPTDKEPKSAKSKPKHKDPNYKQVGMYLPADIHKKLKLASVHSDIEMGDIVAEGIELWLEKNAFNI